MIKGKTTIFTALFFIALSGALLRPLITSAGSLEPSAAPAPTMKTLEEIYNRLDALAKRTRFQVVLNNGEAVLDNNTGLVWEGSTNPTTRNMTGAGTYCSNLILAGKDDWRLPSLDELNSLVDVTQTNPALPLGHPFTNVQYYNYWSSTPESAYSGLIANIDFSNGWLWFGDPSSTMLYVRCVRP